MNERVKQYIEKYVDLLETDPAEFLEHTTFHLTYEDSNTLVRVLSDAGIDIKSYVVNYLAKRIKDNLFGYEGVEILQFAYDTPPFGLTLKQMQELIVTVAVDNGYDISGEAGEEYLVRK